MQIVAVEDARWDTATSERIAGQLYARFAATGGLDAVYGMADNQAAAAIRAAEAASIAVGGGPNQLIVVGGNCLKEGLDAIKAGKMQSTITQIPTELGVRAASAARSCRRRSFCRSRRLPKPAWPGGRHLAPIEGCASQGSRFASLRSTATSSKR